MLYTTGIKIDKKNQQEGLTLVELMVAMAIIAVLATAGLAAYSDYIKKGRDSARLDIAHKVQTTVT